MDVASRERAPDDAGYSLVELLVILVIIGVLASIAIFTYLNQRQTAERASAISTLTNVRLAAESLNAELDRYPSDVAAYEDEQRAYRYVDGSVGSDAVDVVSVEPAGSGVAFAVRGPDRCYYLRIEAGGRMARSTGALPASGRCSASVFTSGAGTGAWD